MKREHFANTKLLVVKVGTSVVTREDGTLALGRVASLVEQIAELIREGKQERPGCGARRTASPPPAAAHALLPPHGTPAVGCARSMPRAARQLHPVASCTRSQL